MKSHWFLVLALFLCAGWTGVAVAQCDEELSGTIMNGACRDCEDACKETDDQPPNPQFTLTARPAGGMCGNLEVLGTATLDFEVVLSTGSNPTVGTVVTRTCFDPDGEGGFDTTSATGECDFGSQVQPGIFDPWLGDPRNPAVLGCGGSTTRPDASTGDVVCEMDGDDVIRMTTFGDDGAQGWSYGLAEEGAVDIDAFSTEGTVSANFRDGGLERGGFVETQLTVGTNAAGNNNNGLVSAIVAAQNLPIVLAPSGEAIILTIEVIATGPATKSDPNTTGRLYFPTNVDDLLKGSGEPVPTLVTFDGRSVSASSGNPQLDPDVNLPVCDLSFGPPPPGADFIRCDANNDSEVNIADAVYGLNFLFRQGPAILCQDAGDCNNDGMLDANPNSSLMDMSDAIFLVTYRFMGGEAPAGGIGCQMAADPSTCPEGSTTCP
jgi:hypothetical protein